MISMMISLAASSSFLSFLFFLYITISRLFIQYLLIIHWIFYIPIELLKINVVSLLLFSIELCLYLEVMCKNKITNDFFSYM